MENAFLFKKKYVKCDVIHLSWSKKEKKKKKKVLHRERIHL